MLHRVPRSLALTAVLLSAASPALLTAQTIRNLPGFQTNTLQANDDGSSGPIDLTTVGFAPGGLNFFGTTETSLFVNNNGNITFGSALSQFTPNQLTTNTGKAIIAPFFADVDTRGPSLLGSGAGGANTSNTPEPFDGSGLVTYGGATVNGRPAFGVDWFSDCANWTGGAPGPSCTGLKGVGYFAGHTDKLNVFQLVLIDRSDLAPGAFDFEYNYGQIQWETGDASGGTNGLGGQSARVGYSNGSGDPGTFFELPGSGINGAFLDGGPNALINSTNVDDPSRFDFRSIGGAVVIPGPPPPVTSVPEPASLTLVATGLVGVLGAARRRWKAPAV